MPTKKEREAAHRARAGVIGMLECCRCTYPLEHHETETHHAEDCPAHGMTLSARSAKSAAAFYEVALHVDTESPASTEDMFAKFTEAASAVPG